MGNGEYRSGRVRFRSSANASSPQSARSACSQGGVPCQSNAQFSRGASKTKFGALAVKSASPTSSFVFWLKRVTTRAASRRQKMLKRCWSPHSGPPEYLCSIVRLHAIGRIRSLPIEKPDNSSKSNLTRFTVYCVECKAGEFMFVRCLSVVSLIAVLVLPAGWCAAACCRQPAKTAAQTRPCCRHRAGKLPGESESAPRSSQARCCCARDGIPTGGGTSTVVESGRVADYESQLVVGFGANVAVFCALSAEPDGQGRHILQCVWRC